VSIEAMAIVLHHSRATPAGKLVLLGIANHQSDSGAWPALATLAKYANVSERRVRQVLRELEETGELETRFQAAGDGQYKTNMYWVRVSCPPDCDGSTAHRQGGNNLQSGGKFSASRGEARFPQTIREPLDNHISSKELDELFERFWESYPRKVARQEALRVFRQLSKSAAGYARVGAEKLADDPNLPEKRFIPHPATWLRREGWLDEPYPPRPKTEDELREEARLRNELEREESRRRRALERAEEKYEPPPKCEHGKSIMQCRICIKRLAEGSEQ